MGAGSRRRLGKRSSATFAAIPHFILESAEYSALTPRAVKALLDLLAQFNGKNNGDLSFAMSTMRARGWKSGANLWAAADELLDSGFTVHTRKGSRHVAGLFAITWLGINECGDKLDVRLAGRPPLHLWRSANRALIADYRLAGAPAGTERIDPRAGQLPACGIKDGAPPVDQSDIKNAAPPVDQSAPPVDQSGHDSRPLCSTGGAVSPYSGDFGAPPAECFLDIAIHGAHVAPAVEPANHGTELEKRPENSGGAAAPQKYADLDAFIAAFGLVPLAGEDPIAFKARAGLYYELDLKADDMRFLERARSQGW